VPNKGKALVLLRTLNDLLKRVSRTGRAAPLSGRILTFLAGAFAINERSAVNLRADFGPEWQDVHIQRDEMVKAVSEKKDDEMQVDSAESSSEVAGRKAQEKAGRYPFCHSHARETRLTFTGRLLQCLLVRTKVLCSAHCLQRSRRTAQVQGRYRKDHSRHQGGVSEGPRSYG
jgi:hypothetical protein